MENEQVKPIQSIPGALARSDGYIKLPKSFAEMPNGGFREYETKWVIGVKRRASKTALHEYYGTLYRSKNYKIHRLICEAFHGPPPKGKNVVIHIDENGLNNRADNLKWGTQKENMNSPKFLEYCRSRIGENSPHVKRSRRLRKENGAN